MRTEGNVIWLESRDDVGRMVSRMLRTGQGVGFDVETTDTDPLSSKLVLMQFKQEGKKAHLLDTRHLSDEELRGIGEELQKLFVAVEVVGHNISFDLAFLWVKLGVVATTVYDTMIAEQVIRGLGISDGRKLGIGFGLKDVAKRYGLGEVDKTDQKWFIGLDQRPEWFEPFPAHVVEYGARDVAVLHTIQKQQIEKLVSLKLSETASLEMRVLPAKVGMETVGVHIDTEGWMQVISQVGFDMLVLSDSLHERLDLAILTTRANKYEDKIRPWLEWRARRDTFAASLDKDWADQNPAWVYTEKHTTVGGPGDAEDVVERVKFKNKTEFKKHYLDAWKQRNPAPKKPTADKKPPNLGSPAQLKDALTYLGFLDVDGKPLRSVSSGTLEPFADADPLIHDILEWRRAEKLITSFGSKLISKVGPDGRLRASYHSIGASTGRMSSYKPNFQQIPGSGIGKDLRQHVTAQAGHVLVISDFSNIELRILAELSRDKNLLKFFAEGKDLHAMTAVLMFGLEVPDGVDMKEFTEADAVINGLRIKGVSYRKIAKTINFGLVYGMGPTKLARTLKVSLETAKALMARYFGIFPGVKEWLAQQHAKVDGAVGRMSSKTVLGRKRFYTVPEKPTMRGGESASDYQERLNEYRKTVAGIKRKMGNSPIQGTSADITKLALALWHERVGYDRNMRLVAVVHDELIVEARDEYESAGTTYAQMAQTVLAEVMDEAAHTFLHRVALPKPVVVISEHWEH